MHVVTHLLAGWALAEQTKLERRDKALIAWASVAPDIDGFGLLIDWPARALGQHSSLYEQFHHVAGHGIAAAVAITLLCLPFLRDRLRAGLLIVLSFHLHLLFDLAGSGGSAAGDVWPIHYLWPFSGALLSWDGQWPLTSWQNTTLTIVLMLYALWLAVRRGYSPVRLFSDRADERFVATLRARVQR